MAKQALVAMKFAADSWRDKTYQAIREVLEHAGYECIRADEIRTSGPVVDEVCRLLRDADLVVIDSSGDSHSVSYEIGFCHGVGRSADRTLLIRNSADLPFNYRHFRHRVYRDVRHLRRLIRDFLGLLEPIALDQLGYTFRISFKDNALFDYILDGAICVFEALRELKFSGHCECYSAELFGHDRSFVVGIMLRPSNKQAMPTHEYWHKLIDLTTDKVQAHHKLIELDTMCSEYDTKRAMMQWLLPCGVAEFKKGDVTRLLGDAGVNSFLETWWKRLHPDSSSPADQ